MFESLNYGCMRSSASSRGVNLTTSRFPVALALHESRRSGFTNRLCDCCNGGVGRVVRSGPKRPSFTRRHCEFDGLLHDALGNALPRLSLSSSRIPLSWSARRAQIAAQRAARRPLCTYGHSGRQQPLPYRHASIARCVSLSLLQLQLRPRCVIAAQ